MAVEHVWVPETANVLLLRGRRLVHPGPAKGRRQRALVLQPPQAGLLLQRRRGVVVVSMSLVLLMLLLMMLLLLLLHLLPRNLMRRRPRHHVGVDPQRPALLLFTTVRLRDEAHARHRTRDRAQVVVIRLHRPAAEFLQPRRPGSPDQRRHAHPCVRADPAELPVLNLPLGGLSRAQPPLLRGLVLLQERRHGLLKDCPGDGQDLLALKVRRDLRDGRLVQDRGSLVRGQKCLERVHLWGQLEVDVG